VEQGEIQIRPALELDVITLLAWKANPEVHEFYGGLEEAGEDFVRGLWQEEWCLKGIITKAGVDVGYIQWYRLTPEIEASCLLETGPSYWGIDVLIGRPELFGQGIGTTAVRQLSDSLLNDGEADIVIIDPQARNDRGVRSYLKAGFSISHRLPSHEYQDGIMHDVLLMVKTKLSPRIRSSRR
jgi:aminoglycoside 6'-N-acetyltransferase